MIPIVIKLELELRQERWGVNEWRMNEEFKMAHWEKTELQNSKSSSVLKRTD